MHGVLVTWPYHMAFERVQSNWSLHLALVNLHSFSGDLKVFRMRSAPLRMIRFGPTRWIGFRLFFRWLIRNIRSKVQYFFQHRSRWKKIQTSRSGGQIQKRCWDVAILCLKSKKKTYSSSFCIQPQSTRALLWSLFSSIAHFWRISFYYHPRLKSILSRLCLFVFLAACQF